jgi:hypothetical protein
MKIFLRITLLVILLPSLSYAVEKISRQEPSKESEIEMLSQDLRRLLSEEMLALQSGMMSVIPAYISGDWSAIETTAGKIKNSYILDQSLTESQLSELNSVLPHDFFEKDQRFHYLAGMLEHAAKSKKPELINFYFAEMNESCVSCHTVFATHKFPALKPENEAKHSH